MDMNKFSSYFLMNEHDALEYVQEKYNFFEKGAQLSCVEIGDGNLNYVFRVKDAATGKSVILKHSGIETRAHSGRHVDTDRSRIEAEILIKHNELAPGLVPVVYGYDPVMCCTCMEDLKNYKIMRTALLEENIYPFFADKITTYLVDVTLPTTDIVLDHKTKKKQVQSFINPDLCDITEQLVYSEAAGNFSGKNTTSNGSKEFVQKQIYEDTDLRLEVAKLKFEFMEHAQALLHGDIHSGSIFINDEGMKAFDVEFAFYGPIGYDVGNVLAHMVFALAHSEATNGEVDHKKDFRNWILKSCENIVDMFRDKFTKKYHELATDNLAKTPGFCQYYLDEIITDTAGAMGTELLRRVVGVAKVKDITSIEDEDKRAEQEQKLLLLAKRCIMNRKSFNSGKDFVDAILVQFAEAL